jgi:hypothetical protein
MSPLAMCATSCASTPSISSCVIDCSRPVDTATSDAFLVAPVAKAFGAPSYTATSGIAMPARWACEATVFISHSSVALDGCWITRAPVDHLAIGFDIHSEMKAPPKPIRAAKPSRAPRFRPLAVR